MMSSIILRVKRAAQTVGTLEVFAGVFVDRASTFGKVA